MRIARLASPLLALALAACNGQDAPSTDPAAATTPAVEAPAAAAETEQKEAAPASDTASFELTMDGVDRWLEATRNIADLVKQDPALEDATAMDASESTDAYVARLDSLPKVVAAIDEAGLSTRDYAMTSEAVTGALFAVGMLEAGAIKELPPELKDNQHVRFVQEHKDEIGAKIKAMQADAG
ncbi:MAG TPA: hypothetical protein VM576_07110 [Xanthomonadaceae bacterium]|nr:hypothetical protein [Xanthomonadaceae bacterium]